MCVVTGRSRNLDLGTSRTAPPSFYAHSYSLYKTILWGKTMSLYARVELSPEYFATDILVDRHDPQVAALLTDVPKNTVIATSTWYPSKDGVMAPANALRAILAYQFCQAARPECQDPVS